MAGETNKALIRRMFAAQLANDMATYSAILADDLTWTIMQYDIDRPRTKDEMLTMLSAVHDNLAGRWEKHIISMISEGDTVAVEATALMDLANGKTYNQRYHYVYRIRDGQVYEVREYCDTAAAKEAFSGLSVVPDE